MLGIVSFLNDAASEMIYPLLPVFLTSVLGVGAAFLGTIEGIAESTVSFLKLLSGWLSDRRKKRKAFVILGYSVAALARPLIGVAVAGWQVLLIRFSDRLGKGVRGSPRDALVVDSCSPDERGRCFGLQRAMDHAGAIIGPLVASLLLFVLSHYHRSLSDNYRLVFVLAVLPGVAAIVALVLGVQEKQLDSRDASLPRLSLRPFDRPFRLFLITLVVFALGNSTDAFLILRARNLGVSVALLPILWSVFHFVKMSFSIPAGTLSDRIGRRKVIISGWLVYALVYLGFGLARSALSVWVLFLVYGFYFALTEGVEKAFVADMVPPDLRGTAYGLYNFAIGIAALPASLLFGLIWQVSGPATAFFFGASLALLAAIGLTVFVRGYRLVPAQG